MDAKNIIIPVAATPVLQAILNFVGLLKLVPLAHWGWNGDIVLPITYVVATGSAAIASLWPVRTNRVKAMLIAVGIIILLVSLYVYTWASTTPPTESNLRWYDVAGYATFFLTYASFGFVVTRVVRVFTKN
jgi:hypothetical protein